MKGNVTFCCMEISIGPGTLVGDLIDVEAILSPNRSIDLPIIWFDST
jgi:hypothetical protein